MKHFFRFILLLAALFYVTQPLFAGSTTLTASQDAYVRMDRSTNNSAMLQFKYQYSPHINNAILLLDLMKQSSLMDLMRLQTPPAMSPTNS